jgi:hypothetical protein
MKIHTVIFSILLPKGKMWQYAECVVKNIESGDRCKKKDGRSLSFLSTLHKKSRAEFKCFHPYGGCSFSE